MTYLGPLATLTSHLERLSPLTHPNLLYQKGKKSTLTSNIKKTNLNFHRKLKISIWIASILGDTAKDALLSLGIAEVEGRLPKNFRIGRGEGEEGKKS